MARLRTADTKILTLIREVRSEQERLQAGYLNKRIMRQLVDSKDFLNMISYTPYANCKTVGELKKRISKERRTLNEYLTKLDSYRPGHQFTLFDELEDKSPEECEKIKKIIEGIEKQMHWLHKCLGICSNQDYFK